MRCAECSASWFVPAPDPVESLTALGARPVTDNEQPDRAASENAAPRAAAEADPFAFDDVDAEAGADAIVASRDDADATDDDYANRPRDDFEQENDAFFERVGVEPYGRDGLDDQDADGSAFFEDGPIDRIGDDDARDEPDADEPAFVERRRRPRGARFGIAGDQAPERPREDALDDARSANASIDEAEDHVLFAPSRDDVDAEPPRTKGRSKTGARSFGGGQRDDEGWGGVEEDDWRPDQRGRRSVREPGFERGPRGEREPRSAAVVDADFIDLDQPARPAREQDDLDFGVDADAAARGRSGAEIRAARRRSTALMRVEDLDPIAERLFSEEFFTALRVQPKELERAIRKARRRAEAREKNRFSPLKAIGWTAWAGAAAASLFVVYTFRNEIVAKFPNAAGAYKAVGINAAPFGLKIEDVRHRLAMSTAGPTIEITGRLRNAAGATVTPPLLQAEALGPGGDLLSRWTFAANAQTVRGGESVEFVTRAPAPEGVVEVALSFAPTEGVRVTVGDVEEPEPGVDPGR